MKSARHLFWIAANIYGRVAGRSWLAPVHHAALLFALHGLGYDNGWKESFTGERWFVKKILRSADIQTALDIGANIGTYTHLLLEELTCEVYAFEPAALTFERLTTNFHPRLHPQRIAVSDHEGKASLYSNRVASPTASLDETFGGSQAETVDVTTVDAFCTRNNITRLDFIKIDTEGYELEVLRGMQETLKKLRPRYLQLEFNIMQLQRGYTVYDLSQLLPDYSFYRLLPNGWLRISPKQFSSNIFMFSNVVAVRET